MAKFIPAQTGLVFHLPAVLALGILSQVVQIVFLRELLMVFHGNELSLGIILAAWMLWVGAGSRAGASLARRLAVTPSTVAAIAIATVMLSAISVFFIRILRSFSTIETGAHFSVFDMTLSCVVVMAPTGLLLGVQFVMLARSWRETDRATDTSGAEKTYAGEACGNIIGGILFSFLLVHVLNAFETVLITGGLMIAAILLLAARTAGNGDPPPKMLKPVLQAALIAIAVLFLFAGKINDRAYELQWRFFSPAHELVDTRQSRHGIISVARRENQYTFFQSGNLVFTSAGPDIDSPALEEQDAVVFAHFAMVQHPRPARVLLIGGGLRGLAREIARHPVARIDYIELDPVLTETARPFLPESTLQAIDGPLVNLVHTDGRRFIKTTDQTYDIIITDIPDPATAVLNRYYTVEFFREVSRRLETGGVFVTGAMSTGDMQGAEVANRNAAIYHTMNRVFPEVLPAGERFLFFFASGEENRISADPSVLRKRYEERGIQTEGFSPGQFALLLEESRLRRINWIIRNHGRDPGDHLERPKTGPLFPGTIREQKAAEKKLSPVNERFFINSDFKPIGYYHTLRFWDELTRGEGTNSFKWIMHIRPWWVLFPVAGCLLVLLLSKTVPPFRKKRADIHLAVLMAAFTTGFSTMTLQVAFIFSFQSLYGFVYEMIGVITALFMAGLTLGTFAASRWIRDKSSTGVLARIQVLIAFFAMVIAAGLPWASGLAHPGIVVLLVGGLTFAGGFLNGVDFPVSTACCQALNNNPEKATGVVYGVELFGACTGAILASVAVAPVLGIAAVCMLAAIANFTAFGALLAANRMPPAVRTGAV